MNDIRIVVNNTDLDLPEDFSIRLSIETPFLGGDTIPGFYSFQSELPITPRNQSCFGFIEQPNVATSFRSVYPCDIYLKGSLFVSGYLQILRIAKNYKFFFKATTGAFKEEILDKKLSELQGLAACNLTHHTHGIIIQKTGGGSYTITMSVNAVNYTYSSASTDGLVTLINADNTCPIVATVNGSNDSFIIRLKKPSGTIGLTTLTQLHVFNSNSYWFQGQSNAYRSINIANGMAWYMTPGNLYDATNPFAFFPVRAPNFYKNNANFCGTINELDFYTASSQARFQWINYFGNNGFNQVLNTTTNYPGNTNDITIFKVNQGAVSYDGRIYYKDEVVRKTRDKTYTGYYDSNTLILTKAFVNTDDVSKAVGVAGNIFVYVFVNSGSITINATTYTSGQIALVANAGIVANATCNLSVYYAADISGTGDIYNRYSICPYVKFDYIFRKCFESIGYTLTGNFLSKTDIDKLFIFNNTPLDFNIVVDSFGSKINVWNENIDLKNHLPDMTIHEFIVSIINTFKLSMIVDFQNESIEINTMPDLFAETDIVDITSKASPEYEKAEGAYGGHTISYDLSLSQKEFTKEETGKFNYKGTVNDFSYLPASNNYYFDYWLCQNEYKYYYWADNNTWLPFKYSAPDVVTGTGEKKEIMPMALLMPELTTVMEDTSKKVQIPYYNGGCNSLAFGETETLNKLALVIYHGWQDAFNLSKTYPYASVTDTDAKGFPTDTLNFICNGTGDSDNYISTRFWNEYFSFVENSKSYLRKLFFNITDIINYSVKRKFLIRGQMYWFSKLQIDIKNKKVIQTQAEMQQFL